MNELTKLHIIEPTLQSQAGHCYGYVTSLLEASAQADLPLELWVGNQAAGLFAGNEEHHKTSVNVHPLFHRKWRKLQVFLLLHHLTRLNQAVFIPTAGRSDLMMLDWLLRRKQQRNNIFLHFHQFTVTPKKLKFLQKIANRHPELNILAPTQSILTIFSGAGFKNCRLVPCPGHQKANENVKTTGKFSKLLYAGVARKDKGFLDIVALVKHLKNLNSNIPVVIQVAPDHSGNYEEIVQEAMTELRGCDYPGLKIYEQALTKEEYQALFEDAICLQLYDLKSYASKFSGVTLDALYSGCAVITKDGTWIADTVKRFEAGEVITESTLTAIFAAVQKIIDSFAKMQSNSLYAGKVLREEHDPLHTLLTIKRMFRK